MNIFYTDYANKTDSFGDCTIENCAGDCSALRGWFDILGNTLIHFLAESLMRRSMLLSNLYSDNEALANRWLA